MDNSKLAQVATALETAAGVSTSANATKSGYWKRIAAAAESLAGPITAANENIAGYQLRTAIALEILEGGSGAEENLNESGYVKRITDALELSTGVTAGSTFSRLVTAANAYVPPALWTPTNLATAPALSLDARSGVTRVAGAVSAWLDQSANAYSFAQAVEANKPIYSATGFNGTHPAITGDGVSDYLQSVANFAVLADGWQVFWLIDNWTAGYLFRDQADGNAVPFVEGANSFNMYDGGSNSIAATMGNPMLFQFDSVGAGTARLNGTALGAQASSTQTIGLLGQKLNLLAGGGPGNYANASIAVLIMATAMSAADRLRLEGWAAHNFGVASLLPSNHAYKAGAPRV
jgi:hypothetical protein